MKIMASTLKPEGAGEGMIIISQDELSVVNTDNIAGFNVRKGLATTEDLTIVAYADGVKFPLATYDNKARIKKVIENLIKAFNEGQKTFYMPKE